ncbi:MAG: DUF389 domain-containing protein [Actinomycetota bacterium]
MALLEETPTACNLVFLPGASMRPVGDVILCDLLREDASVILSDLRELGIDESGSITMEAIDSQMSAAARRAERSVRGLPSDAVVWEEVEQRTSEAVELSASYLIFMTIAMFIAAVGIYQNSPILIVGAMIVGPEFGPLAGLCVALVTRRKVLAMRSFWALLIGFPVGMCATFLAVLIFKATGVMAATFTESDATLAGIISRPDFFSFFVAFCAGIAGMLSLTSAKSGALVGVLVSITTIPAAANISITAAYGEWDSWLGSVGQLLINLSMIVVAGTLTLAIQRAFYSRRRRLHMLDPMRTAAGLPVGAQAEGDLTNSRLGLRPDTAFKSWIALTRPDGAGTRSREEEDPS